MDYYSSLFASKVSGGGGGGGSGEWTSEGLAMGTEPNGNVNLGGATYVDTDAFKGRTMASVTGNSVLEVKNSAFEGTSISSFSFPLCTKVGASSFRRNTSLVSINMPLVTNFAGTYTFAGCTSLTSLELSGEATISDSAFDGCTSLTSVSLPNIKKIGNSCFKNCRMPIIVLPKVTEIIANALQNNNQLATADIGTGLSTLNGSTFSSDTNFTVLILRKTGGAVSLANTNVFNSTPFASNGSGGTLYVPSALISSYQSASNWSTILGYANNQIKAIEGSIYETKYADGTTIGA